MDSANLRRGWVGLFFYPEFGGSVIEDELLADAWERMTWGGVNGLNADMPIDYWRFVVGRNIAYKVALDQVAGVYDLR